MLKITDLVDTKNSVVLHDLEMKSVRGGDCDYGRYDYKPGEKLYFGGRLNICTDYPWYEGGDDWSPVT